MRRGSRYAPRKKVSVPRRPRQTGRTKAVMQRRQNALAINSIQRQVNRLKAVDYGPVQYQCHRMSEQFCSDKIPADEAADPGIDHAQASEAGTWVEVRSDRPLLFDATDFTHAERVDSLPGSAFQNKYRKLGCRVWSTTTMANGKEGIHRRACWEIPPHMRVDPYWKDSCEQAIRGDYRTIFANYEFEVRGYPVLQDTKVTFTVLTLKPKAVMSDLLFKDGIPQTIVPTNDGLLDSVTTTWLPDGLPNLANITENDHKLNREYFRVWSQKSVFINSQFKGAPVFSAHSTTAGMGDDSSGQWTEMAGNQTRGGYTTSNIKKVTFSFNPRKVYKRVINPDSTQWAGNKEQDLNTAVTEDVLGMDLPTMADKFINVNEYQGGDYGPYTLPVDKPLWLLISTSDEKVTTETGHIATSDQPIHDNKVQIRCTRYVKWRDEQHGPTREV